VLVRMQVWSPSGKGRDYRRLWDVVGLDRFTRDIGKCFTCLGSCLCRSSWAFVAPARLCPYTFDIFILTPRAHRHLSITFQMLLPASDTREQTRWSLSLAWLERGGPGRQACLHRRTFGLEDGVQGGFRAMGGRRLRLEPLSKHGKRNAWPRRGFENSTVSRSGLTKRDSLGKVNLSWQTISCSRWPMRLSVPRKRIGCTA
jgi:hypothetical protein